MTVTGINPAEVLAAHLRALLPTAKFGVYTVTPHFDAARPYADGVMVTFLAANQAGAINRERFAAYANRYDMTAEVRRFFDADGVDMDGVYVRVNRPSDAPKGR